LTLEQKRKVEKSQNIVLAVLVVFVFLNIWILLWFVFSMRP
jgi:hypothetical protein